MKTPWRVCLARGCNRRNQNVQPFLQSEQKQKGNEKQRENKNIHNRKKAAQCAAKQPTTTTTTTSSTKERPKKFSNTNFQSFSKFQNLVSEKESACKPSKPLQDGYGAGSCCCWGLLLYKKTMHFASCFSHPKYKGVLQLQEALV